MSGSRRFQNKLYLYLIGILITSGLLSGAWWVINDRAAKAAEIDNLQAAVHSYADNIKTLYSESQALQMRFQSARNRESKDLNILDEHDLQKLTEGKSGLIADRFNDKYNGMLDAINQASRPRDNPPSAP